MTDAQLKVAFCKLGVEKSKYICLKTDVLQAMLQDILQSIGMKTKQNMEDAVCQVSLSKEISRPNSLYFTKSDVLAVSTLLGTIQINSKFH